MQERFTLKEKNVIPFLEGRYTVDQVSQLMSACLPPAVYPLLNTRGSLTTACTATICYHQRAPANIARLSTAGGGRNEGQGQAR